MSQALSQAGERSARVTGDTPGEPVAPGVRVGPVRPAGTGAAHGIVDPLATAPCSRPAQPLSSIPLAYCDIRPDTNQLDGVRCVSPPVAARLRWEMTDGQEDRPVLRPRP